MKEEKYFLALDEYEIGTIIRTLNEKRTELLSSGKSTDGIDDLLIKISKAPIKRFKIIEKYAQTAR